MEAKKLYFMDCHLAGRIYHDEHKQSEGGIIMLAERTAECYARVARENFYNFAATLPPTCLKVPVYGENWVVADGWQGGSKLRKRGKNEEKSSENTWKIAKNFVSL